MELEEGLGDVKIAVRVVAVVGMVAVVAVVGVAKTELSDEDPLLDTEELLEDDRLLLLDEDRLELTLELLEEEELEDIEAELMRHFRVMKPMRKGSNYPKTTCSRIMSYLTTIGPS